VLCSESIRSKLLSLICGLVLADKTQTVLILVLRCLGSMRAGVAIEAFWEWIRVMQLRMWVGYVTFGFVATV
jgi:hypothetical protein